MQTRTDRYWVVPEKIHTSPTEEISAIRRGRGKKLFLIIVNVLVHPKEVGGSTSYFLCGGGMDLFWNDPFSYSIFINIIFYKYSSSKCKQRVCLHYGLYSISNKPIECQHSPLDK